MNKPPAFQFYPDDFIGGTAHFTAEEVGAYILLLCYQWDNGFVPNDDDMIRRIARITQAFHLGFVKQKFKVGEDGLLRNERMEREREKQRLYREKQRENGKRGGRPTLGYPSDNPSLSQPLAEPNPTVNPTPNPEKALRSPLPSPKATVPAEALREVFDAWNLMAAQYGLPKCSALTDKRKPVLQKRLTEPLWIENWRPALERISKSSFCLGHGESGWRADFDFFIRPDSVTKAMEGKYDDRSRLTAPPRTGTGPRPGGMTDDQWWDCVRSGRNPFPDDSVESDAWNKSYAASC